MIRIVFFDDDDRDIMIIEIFNIFYILFFIQNIFYSGIVTQGHACVRIAISIETFDSTFIQ